jgi:hypothetical protein
MEIITNEKDDLEQSEFYWRERDGVKVLVCGPLERDRFTNGFSTRKGGVSPMPDNDLNLAGFDDDVSVNIHENRRRFLTLFEGTWTLGTVWQTHSANVRLVHDAEDARLNSDKDKCDALISNAQGVLLGVKTADCVPVLLGDTKTKAFASIHAGWRGTLQSIVINAINKMREEFGTDPKDIRAALGPAASGKRYEVGRDVIETFRAKFPDADSLFTPTREGHALVDIHKANFNQLVEAGVGPGRIHIAPFCTMTRTDLFFSYRVEKKLYGKTGRLLSVIGRK